MKVAIIDSGVRKDLLPNALVVDDLIVDHSGLIYPRSKDIAIVTSHGTTCAQIISTYTNNIEFCSLQIFQDNTERATYTQLLSALQWCLEHQIPVIHMSIGTTNLRDVAGLRKIIARMLGNGQILVSAYSNTSPVSFPAQFSGVFGVSAAPHLIDDQYTTDPIRRDTNFLASSRHNVLHSKHNTPIANSFAASTITSAVCRVLGNMKSPINSNTVFHALTGLIPKLLKPDFVEDAIIVNPPQFLSNEQHFFFTLTKCVRSLSELSSDEIYSHSIVYFPDESANYNIGNFEISFQRLLYCGNANTKLIQKEAGCLMWSESSFHLIPNLTDSYTECFSIFIEAGEGSCIYAICALRDIFMHNGYQCLSISDEPYSYLYGIEYLRNIDNPQYIQGFFSSEFNPDVIILGSSKNLHKRSDNAFFVTIGHSKHNSDYVLPDPPKNTDIFKLYNYIVKKFTC